jgi:Fic family protein
MAPADPQIEAPNRIEPCFVEQPPADLLDLLTELPAAARLLGARLHPRTAASLAKLVRVMNCYYSNLIEGHNTRPIDIERALANDLDTDQTRRNLQIEARAHIQLQETIDADHAAGRLSDPVTVDFIQGLHREFYQDAPEAMLQITGAGRDFSMTPGEFRTRPEHAVAIGRHVPPRSAAVAPFMDYFAERYAFSRLSPAQRILALPAAHHRLNYIHPFPDGNGRVSRLMSHAMALQAGIGAHGLWSISRGLARGLKSNGEYKSMMDHADTPRQGDLDGRGNLSLAALSEFSIWFLTVCLDQVRFMSQLFDIDGLTRRLRAYPGISGLRPAAATLLVEIFHRGEIARGEATVITGLGERTARTLLGELLKDGIISAVSEKSAVYLSFPVEKRDILFPRLFAGA